MDFTDRPGRVLAALVREYIACGEPVASSVLVGAAGLGVSSATVRNIVAQLEHEGFVQQPHTSAGRIPTDRGYRFYVDLLLESKRSARTASAVEARLRRDSGGSLVDSVLSQVSHVVSQASGQVGFAIRPAHEAAVFDRVEFIPLSSTRVLVKAPPEMRKLAYGCVILNGADDSVPFRALPPPPLLTQYPP